MRAIDEAMKFHKQGRMGMAEEFTIKALSENFDDDKALYLYGTMCIQKGIIGLAANMFIRALYINPKSFACWNNLGNCYKALNKDDDAGVCFAKALAIEGMSPNDYADANNNLGTLYINNGNPEEGETFISECLKLEPENPNGHWNNALIQLEQGKFKEGFGEYHYGFKTKNRMYREYGDMPNGEKIPEWDGSKGKTVIVWGEQGIGDELMFASILPDMIKDCKEVIIDCHPRLVNIFKESFPELAVYGTRKDMYIDWIDKHPDVNGRIAMGELAKFYRNDIEDFNGEAYLKAPNTQKYIDKLGALGKRPKIGISWTGGGVKTRQDYRQIPLEQWKDILSLDADFISLQYTPDAYKTISDVEDRFGVRIHHFPSAVEAEDYGETASLIDALDLVITVNTSAHHLAGALGKETWTLTPKKKAWRYYSTDGVTIPWYESVRLYNSDGKWDTVMKNVCNDLKAKLALMQRSSISIAGIDHKCEATATAVSSLSVGENLCE